MFLFSRASPGRERTPDSLPHIGPRFPPKGRFVTSTSLLPLFLISASLLIPFNTSFFHLSFFAVFLSIKLLTIQFTSIGEFIVCSFFLSLSLFVFVPFLSSVKVSRNYLSRYDENKSFLFFFFHHSYTFFASHALFIRNNISFSYDGEKRVDAIFCSMYSKGAEPEFRSPRVKLLWDRWRHVWMLAWERQRRLQDKYNYIQELDRVANFSWEDWRKRVRTR